MLKIVIRKFEVLVIYKLKILVLVSHRICEGEIISTIFLPTPSNVQDANQVSWGRGDMNALQIAT